MSSQREMSEGGRLIVNADDWGRDVRTTEQTLECVNLGSVSAVSAMVFMEDSERAATVAQQQGVDTGLHLNLSDAFTGDASPRLREHHDKVRQYLRGRRLAQVVYHPGLNNSFRYVVEAQIAEYTRLYAKSPARVDGHHHMHLCANVVFNKLLPAGTVARRNFSFQAGEKGFVNRTYRGWVDRLMSRRHTLPDYLFSLPPIEVPGRLERIFSLARHSVVELETHPINQDEYEFLTGVEIFRRLGGVPVSRGFVLSREFDGEKQPSAAAA